MIPRLYNAKEQAILEGVIRLINSGADVGSLTAEDMAKSAGIGKGTLYLYFSSKEDILSHAIGYCIQNQLRELEAAAAQTGTFSSRFTAALSCLRDSAARGNAVFRLMISGLLGEEFYQRFGGEFRKEVQSWLDQILDSLIRAGVRDGVFSASQETDYLRQVILGAVLGFCYRHLCPPCPDGKAVQRGMDYALYMVIAAGKEE